VIIAHFLVDLIRITTRITMKKLFIIALIIPLFSFFGCPEDILEINFTMTMADVEFIQHPDEEPGVHWFDTAVVVSTLEEELDKHGADISKVKSVKLKTAKMSIVNPVDFTFSPVDYAQLTFRSESFPEQIIAEANINGQAIQSVDLDVNTDVDLLSAMKDDEMEIFGSVTINQAVDEQVIFRGEVTVEVVADPL